MKLREFKGPSKGLYRIYYRFHNGSEHLSTICRNTESSTCELYSNVDASRGSLLDISMHGHSVYTRKQIVDFIKERPSYNCNNVTIKDITTESIVPINTFLREG